jgi:hypothetical protein
VDLDTEVELGERDIRVRLGEVEAGHQCAPVQAEHRLEQTDDAGRPFQVSDVRLGGTDQQRRRPLGGRAEHSPERGGFDRVARSCSGAVQLDVLHLAGCDSGLPVGLSQHFLLAGP